MMLNQPQQLFQTAAGGTPIDQQNLQQQQQSQLSNSMSNNNNNNYHTGGFRTVAHHGKNGLNYIDPGAISSGENLLDPSKAKGAAHLG